MKKIELAKNEVDNLWNVVFTSQTMKHDVVLTIDLHKLCNDLLSNFSSSVLTKGSELDITSISLSLKLIFIILRKKINQLTSVTVNQIIPSENLTFQKNKNLTKKPRKVIPVTFKPIPKITNSTSAAQLKEFEFNISTQDTDLGKLSVFNSQNSLEIPLNSEDFEVARASYQEELLNSEDVPRDDFDNFDNNNGGFEDFGQIDNDNNENNDTTNNLLSLNNTTKIRTNRTNKNKLKICDKETLISSKKIKRQLKNTKNIIKELKYNENDENNFVIKEKDFLEPFTNMIKQSMQIIKSFNINRELNENKNINNNDDNVNVNDNGLDESGITLGNFENLDVEGNMDFDNNNDFNNDYSNNFDNEFNIVDPTNEVNQDFNDEEETEGLFYKEYPMKTTFNKETVGAGKREAGREFMNVLGNIGNGKIDVEQKTAYGDITIKPINN
eukprot:GAHX01001319.1.p1 GENE.GAHX01001319.1~~GAHX01001319.1.p1  ORF type:complete len:442 (-),score=117.66 GAHX01001319.1:19-1344(-)